MLWWRRIFHNLAALKLFLLMAYASSINHLLTITADLIFIEMGHSHLYFLLTQYKHIKPSNMLSVVWACFISVSITFQESGLCSFTLLTLPAEKELVFYGVVQSVCINMLYLASRLMHLWNLSSATSFPFFLSPPSSTSPFFSPSQI